MRGCMSEQTPLTIAIVGLGFWARFQVRAWHELERQGLVKIAALCDNNLQRATCFRDELGLQNVPIYSDPEQMLSAAPQLDAVDLITATPTHYSLTRLVLAHRIPVIVQKPMAQTLSHALEMVRLSRNANIPLLVHEDFRWQRPFVTLKRLLADHTEQLGTMVDIRVEWESGTEDFLKGQPYFAEQPNLVNGEVGVHLIDTIRFLSGQNVTRIASAHMHRGVDARYRGEDLVHVTLDVQGGITAAYRVAFSAAHKDERPPQTFVRMIFERGTIELGSDYQITLTMVDRSLTGGITKHVRTLLALPDAASWTQVPALKEYRSWLGQWECSLPTNLACAEFVRGNVDAAGAVTTGQDNLNVLATTFGAYLSSQTNAPVPIPRTIEELQALALRLDEAKIGYPGFPTTARPG